MFNYSIKILMTYSIDIINLCFIYLVHEKMNKKEVSNILKISISIINIWIKKFNKNYTECKPVTEETIKEYKVKNIHGSNKKYRYYDVVSDYVKDNPYCTLLDIKKNTTNNNISVSTICRILKEIGITLKKVNNTVVCKNIDKILDNRKEYCKNFIELNENFNDYVSIDESSFCVNDYKNIGYSLKGKSINRNIKHKSNKKKI